MAQYVEGPYIVEDQPDGTRKVVGYANQQQPQRIVTKPADTYARTKAANEAAASQYDPAMAAAELVVKQQQAAIAAQSNAREQAKFEREQQKGPMANPETIGAAKAKIAAARQLRAQLQSVEKLFQTQQEGQRSIWEYAPSEQNKIFDKAVQGLMPLARQAFRVPGSGADTDKEAQYIEGLMPDRYAFDGTNRQAIDQLYSMLDAVEQEYGPIAGDPPRDEQQGAAFPEVSQSGNPPQGRDTTPALMSGGNGGGPGFGNPAPDPSGFVPYGSQTRRENNPQWKGVNEAVKGMIVAGQTPDQISAYLQERGISTDALTGVGQAIDYYRRTGKKDFRVNVDDIEVPMSSFEQFRNNAPQTRIGTAAATALNAGGFGVPQALAGDQLQYLRDQNPGSAFAGDVAGIIGATSALGKVGSGVAGRVAPQLLTGGGKVGSAARAIAPDAAYGAIYGGVTESDPLTGAATATLGSAGGQLIGKGLQKTFTGVTDPAVQYLTGRGIPLTIGQTLGNRGIMGRTMNKLESVPVLGDMLARNRMDGLQAFEREALNDVVSPVGGSVTTGGAEGLQQAQGAVSQAYGDALSGVNVSPDAQFINEAQTAMQAGASVPKFGEDFTYMMNREVGPVFGQGGRLSGPQLQSALQSLGKMRSGFSKNPDAMASYAADATAQMDDALTGLVSRQSPDTMPAYNAAKGAFQRLAPFENARVTAINQEAITPAQLARAITSNTKNYGGRGAAARGDNLTDLIRYGQEVLPPTVPNSGTFDRGLAAAVLPAALGGTAYGADQYLNNPALAGTIATLAALSTKTGQKAAQKALTKRPKALKRVGGLFGRREAQKGLAGMVTAPLLIED